MRSDSYSSNFKLPWASPTTTTSTRNGAWLSRAKWSCALTANGRIHQVQPPNIHALLQQLRQAIHKAAPHAEEVISYRKPAFNQCRVLVSFAVFKDPIGWFSTNSAVEAFTSKLSAHAKPERAPYSPARTNSFRWI